MSLNIQELFKNSYMVGDKMIKNTFFSVFIYAFRIGVDLHMGK